MEVLYRKSSNEVIAIKKDGAFIGSNSTYFGILVDPACPDGMEVLDGTNTRRVLGYAKINDNGVIRNATQIEIDTFDTAQKNDQKLLAVDEAKRYLERDPYFRRIMKAFMSVMVDELNAMRAKANMPAIDLVQFRTKIKNRINKDD